MKQNGIAFSFDDGRKDNIVLFNEFLYPNRIPATFNITTNYVDQTICVLDSPCKNLPMSIEDVRTLHKCDFVEIALHGANHKNEISDIVEGKNKLLKWLGCNEKELSGFASPNSHLLHDDVCEMKAVFTNHGIDYCRISFSVAQNSFAKTLFRKALRVIPNKFAFNYVFGDSLMKEKDGIVVYSIPVLHNTTFSEIKYIIDRCIKENKSVVFMMHSVLKKNENYYGDIASFDFGKFVKVCNYAKNKGITIMTVKDLYENL